MVDLYPLSLIIGFAIGIGVTVVHYRCGWNSIWDNEEDKNRKTNRKEKYHD